MKQLLSYPSMLRGLADNILRATSTKGASYFIDGKGSKLEKWSPSTCYEEIWVNGSTQKHYLLAPSCLFWGKLIHKIENLCCAQMSYIDFEFIMISNVKYTFFWFDSIVWISLNFLVQISSTIARVFQLPSYVFFERINNVSSNEIYLHYRFLE